MRIHHRTWTRPIAFLCISLIFLLVLTSISVAFLPHTHGSGDSCAVCAMVESSLRILLGLSLGAAVLYGAVLRLFVSFTHPRPRSVRDRTPVGLKVKLSD